MWVDINVSESYGGPWRHYTYDVTWSCDTINSIKEYSGAEMKGGKPCVNPKVYEISRRVSVYIHSNAISYPMKCADGDEALARRPLLTSTAESKRN